MRRTSARRRVRGVTEGGSGVSGGSGELEGGTRLRVGVSGGSVELFRGRGTRLRVGVSRGLLRRTSARRRVRGVTEGGSCCDSGVVGLETFRPRCMCRRAC